MIVRCEMRVHAGSRVEDFLDLVFQYFARHLVGPNIFHAEEHGFLDEYWVFERNRRFRQLLRAWLASLVGLVRRIDSEPDPFFLTGFLEIFLESGEKERSGLAAYESTF